MGDLPKDTLLSQIRNTFLSMARLVTTAVPPKQQRKPWRAFKESGMCKRLYEENCTRNDIFSSFLCVFCQPVCFFTPFHCLICVRRLTHFMLYRQKRTAPTCRGGSLVCWMMSVFGEDECVSSGGGSVKGKRVVCVCVLVGANSRSPTELLNSVTDRENRGLFTRMKQNVPLLICVQSKNNLPSLSTAHWGKLVKLSVSKERQSESKLHETKEKEVWKETRNEEGDRNGKLCMSGRGETEEQESPWKDVMGEWMNLQRRGQTPVVSTVPSSWVRLPVGLGAVPLHSELAPRCLWALMM